MPVTAKRQDKQLPIIMLLGSSSFMLYIPTSVDNGDVVGGDEPFGLSGWAPLKFNGLCFRNGYDRYD